MKKYLFGSIAVLFAVAFVAFKAPRLETTLVFTGDVTDQTQVANASLWHEITPISCNGFNVKACTMKVDDSKLTGSSPRVLDGSLVAITTASAVQGGITYYRPTVTTGINSVQNKNN